MYASDCGAAGGLQALDPFNQAYDKGPSCFDATQNWHFNLLYHVPNIKSDKLVVNKLLNGWWLGNIVTIQSGYPFTPVLGVNRSNSGVFGGAQPDRPDLGTGIGAATFSCSGTSSAFPGAPACGSQGTPGKVTYTYIPFDPSTVITGNPNMWFNPLMFQLPQAGTLGDASRDLLRGPGVGTWHVSFNKDTKMSWLGENGSLQFRAEIFNILNRANFSLPSGTTFTGTLTDVAGATEAPVNAVAKISSTSTSSRQMQLALKLVF